MRDALVIEGPTGGRWNLALELLRTGEGRVRCGQIELGRSVNGPAADGAIHVAVDAQSARPGHEGADEAVAQGLAQLEELEATSSELVDLFGEFGRTVEYVFDYGDGAIRLGAIDGTKLRWTDG